MGSIQFKVSTSNTPMHHTTYYSRWMLVRVIFSLVNTVNNVVYVVAADNKKKKNSLYQTDMALACCPL